MVDQQNFNGRTFVREYKHDRSCSKESGNDIFREGIIGHKKPRMVFCDPIKVDDLLEVINAPEWAPEPRTDNASHWFVSKAKITLFALR